MCAARKRHIEAYAAIQKSYKALAKQIEPDHRIDPASAVTAFKAMVKDCIDHKTSLTTGGHNIMIDIIPNDIATACLNIGKTVLDNETYLVHARGHAGSLLSLMQLNVRLRRGV